MRSLRFAFAFVVLAVASGISGAVPARAQQASPMPSASPSPGGSPGPNGHLLRHANFSVFAAQDPGLVSDSRASTTSGLHAFRSLDPTPVAGFLEPSEGVVGQCGKKYYAAVPLDTGSAAGFAGWLIYKPLLKRHVAVIQASEGLEFRGNRIRASNFVFDPKTDDSSSLHRVDSWVCKPAGLRLVESHVLPVP